MASVTLFSCSSSNQYSKTTDDVEHAEQVGEIFKTEEAVNMSSNYEDPYGTQVVQVEQEETQIDSTMTNYVHEESFTSVIPNKRAYLKSDFPTLKSKPFMNKGHTMNAYLFSRKGQSWSDLSKALYNRPDRAQLLKKWNNKAKLNQSAQIIYYNSPFRPNDKKEMLYIMSDFDLNLKSYTAKKGDSLSLIAKRKLGSLNNWNEIAHINKNTIKHPDRIQIGQTINLPVRNLQKNTQHTIGQIIKKTVRGTPVAALTKKITNKALKALPSKEYLKRQGNKALNTLGNLNKQIKKVKDSKELSQFNQKLDLHTAHLLKRIKKASSKGGALVGSTVKDISSGKGISTDFSLKNAGALSFVTTVPKHKWVLIISIFISLMALLWIKRQSSNESI